MQNFGERLTAARRAREMTQEALARAAAVSRQTISSWERGRTMPDVDTIRRLSDILSADLLQPAEEQGDAPTTAPSTEAPDARAACSRRATIRRVLAGAAALICVLLSVFLLLRRDGAQTGGGDAFDAGFYQQKPTNEPGKAYLTFESRTWEESGENATFQHYDFTMYERNGVGFSISRLELQFEGRSGAIRSAMFSASDLRASHTDPDILPYGSLTIDGGFPLGEFTRAGIAVYGNDAKGEPLTFYTLIAF